MTEQILPGTCELARSDKSSQAWNCYWHIDDVDFLFPIVIAPPSNPEGFNVTHSKSGFFIVEHPVDLEMAIHAVESLLSLVAGDPSLQLLLNEWNKPDRITAEHRHEMLAIRMLAEGTA